VVRYYKFGDDLADSDILPGQSAELENFLSHAEDLRRILMQLPGGRYVRLVLHWYPEMDLAAIDRLVAEGSADAENFRGALVGDVFTIRCKSCGSSFDAVVADTGNPFFADLTERLRTHRYVNSCPVCEAPLQPHVLRILRKRA
jgi:hypothetical protein